MCEGILRAYDEHPGTRLGDETAGVRREDVTQVPEFVACPDRCRWRRRPGSLRFRSRDERARRQRRIPQQQADGSMPARSALPLANDTIVSYRPARYRTGSVMGNPGVNADTLAAGQRGD